MFTVAIDTGPLAWDFRNELYPQAQDLVHGRNPYPEAIWPPIAAALAIPFTVLPSETAGLVFAIVGVACMGLALWLVDRPRLACLRRCRPLAAGDRRDPPRASDTAPLPSSPWCGDIAMRRFALGSRWGWPVRSSSSLAAGRLAARHTTDRSRARRGRVAIASILPRALFAPLDDYGRTLLDVSRAFDQDSYSLFGFLTQLT